MIVSVTRLKLRSARFLPLLLWNNLLILWSVGKAPGFRGGKLLIDSELTFWTATVWRDLAAMRDFRNGGAHRRALPKLPGWCSESAFVHWEQEAGRLPDWNEAHAKLEAEGRTSPVQYPSPEHRDRKFGKPRPPSRLKQISLPAARA